MRLFRLFELPPCFEPLIFKYCREGNTSFDSHQTHLTVQRKLKKQRDPICFLYLKCGFLAVSPTKRLKSVQKHRCNATHFLS